MKRLVGVDEQGWIRKAPLMRLVEGLLAAKQQAPTGAKMPRMDEPARAMAA